jgi:DNA-directed RNA polymerase
VVAEGFEPEIVKDKTLNSAAANFTHACDAAHLALTVNASVAAGITNIASIHDCFACLAPQALEFNIIIREQMQRMYEEHDPLAELKARVPSAPPLPARGPLDLAELPFSYYAYA